MTPQPDRTRAGLLYALAAFGAWGLFPIFLKGLVHVPPLEILAHRVLWSVGICALLTLWERDPQRLKTALASRKVMGTLLLTAALISLNWLIYIHAINSGQILAASLGYYINPLLNVVLGVVVLKERLSNLQKLAVLLAAAGTANLALNLGELPWISLTLPLLFSLYGLLRKTVAVEAVHGLLVETTILAPLALGYIVYLSALGRGHFLTVDIWPTDVLLVTAGLATTLPLVWFTAGARRLHYSTLGLIQYLAPSIQFLLAVFVYGEHFGTAHMVTFGFIWCGLLVYALDNLRTARAARRVLSPDKA